MAPSTTPGSMCISVPWPRPPRSNPHKRRRRKRPMLTAGLLAHDLFRSPPSQPEASGIRGWNVAYSCGGSHGIGLHRPNHVPFSSACTGHSGTVAATLPEQVGKRQPHMHSSLKPNAASSTGTGNAQARRFHPSPPLLGCRWALDRKRYERLDFLEHEHALHFLDTR